MFREKTEIEKANLFGERLVGGTTETATFITEELGKRFGVGFRNENSVKQFLIEVVVFSMHLIDRLAFTHLGAAKREVFADRFVITVTKEIRRSLSKEISAGEFSKALRDTYNRRQGKSTLNLAHSLSMIFTVSPEIQRRSSSQ